MLTILGVSRRIYEEADPAVKFVKTVPSFCRATAGLLESSPMAMEDMRTILRGSLGRSLHALDEADRLAAAWPVACGRAMAGHGEIVGFFGGTVTVAVSDSAWLSQMMSVRSILQNDLARIARVKVTAIHFEMKG